MTEMKKQAQSKQELRNFGLITGAITVVLFGLLLPWLFERSLPLWPWVVAAVLWFWALVWPASLDRVYRGWMAIGHVLGWINTRIILGIMFYGLFLPVGMLMRLLGKDPLARSLDKTRNSYRIAHAARKKDHVERPY